MTPRGLDRFWNAAGAFAPLRLLVWNRNWHEPVEHRFSRPFAIVGRTMPADLVLDHPQISRKHAFLQVVGRRAYCLDLGSRSALSWNGRSRRSGWIEPGKPVEIGPYRIDLATSSADDDDPAPAPDRGPLNGSGSTRFVLESSGASSHPRQLRIIDRPFTLVGRAPECDLRLGDLSVSRYHCILIRLGTELWAVDLLGRGGIEVNARPEQWACLDDASLLRLGRYLFTVRRERPPCPKPEPMTHPRAFEPARRVEPSANLPALLSELPPLIERPALPAPTYSVAPLALEGPQHAELARVAEAMIAPLIDQFSLMQQHLFDQYHQSMMQMMAVFARLHQEQQGLVDRELRKIRRLTKEVRALRRELDRQQEAASRAHPLRNGDSQHPADVAPIASDLGSGASGTPEDYRAAQARIIARMTELQAERQGRWQRLVRRLGGAGSEHDR